MRLLSVNVGLEEPIEGAKSSGKTGIFKRPTHGPVRVTKDGLAGDEISDKENHGGVDQAVYLFGSPDYEWWSEELGRELAPGTFGENLTVSGLESAGAYIGDRFSIGSAVLEVTAPRIPCVTLAVRMGDPAFLKRFRRAERPGLYCRVIRPGEVAAGDPVESGAYSGERVPAIELFRVFFEPDPDEVTLRRHLAAPIAVRAREMNERRLARVLERDAETRSIV
ncbi:MOSC domain-containing protein [Rubrobacter tropicus]|uniref:MOSC domain-containing protein n=1 Tax=Rubrobacter tropicus TaxID=2653851 RepID=A0A6G8Q8T7_9ACTN|nr:MOSC domain-containing protein [Rubrobacter tropicus]QIN82904.1 MOSC domain-containing protein [Rubrobacter tropicus]